jgi:gliding motility-associated-like protein
MMLKKTALLVCTFLCVFFLQSQSFGQSTTFKSGTAIIDMGSAAPTVKNSLKPYGLIYALLKNNHVPVSYVVNGAKVKDGIDFIYNGKGYKGGTFIVSADYINTDIQTVLTNWTNQGVVVDYAISSFTVDVTYKFNFVPSWVMDKANGSIGVAFLSAAGIPASAYSFKTPAQLGSCDDLFVLPHADPTWANHGNLLTWNATQKGSIWAGCHAASELENLWDGADPATRMNFLSTDGLVKFTDHNPTSTPFKSALPGDPVGQYVGKTDNAQLSGSETVYLPKTGSAWRPLTNILTTSPAQQDLPSLDAGAKAVENIYGRAFDISTNGYVAYQASHNIGGQNADQVAAQRMFFNFSFFAMHDKIPPIINLSLGAGTAQLKSTPTTSETSAAMTANNLGAGTITGYSWSVSPASAGTLNTPGASSTTFTAAVNITQITTCIVTCTVTEACGRVSFDSKTITIIPDVGYPTPATINKSIPESCAGGSITFNIFDDNVDANGGARTMTSFSGIPNGTVSSSADGKITFTATAGYKGTTSGTYKISNDGGVTESTTGTINITVGDETQIPVLLADAATAIVNSLKVIEVLPNDKTNQAAINADGLYIRNVSWPGTPKGYVYLNADGRTLTYLSKNGEAGIDEIQYQACNTAGYCSTGTLSVTLVANCGSGLYQSNQTLTPIITSLSATADTYLNQSAVTTPNGAATTLILRSVTQSRPLITFGGLSGIPTTSLIKQATLSLTAQATFTTPASNITPSLFPITVDALIRSYVEATTFYDVTAGWASAGAGGSGTDFTTTGEATFPYIPSLTVNAGEEIGASITAMVQNWVLSPTSNKGLRLLPPTGRGTTPYTFHSREGATPPKLYLSYYPCLVTPTSYAPIVYPDAVATSSALTLTIDALLNDKNYYGNTQTITLLNTSGAATVNTISGTAAITNAGTKILYTPSGGYVGIDTLTYTVTDQSNGFTSTGTIRISVTRSAPTLVNDVATVNSGTLTNINVGANDIGYGGLGAPIIVTQPSNGIAVVNGNNVDYTPTAGYTGTDQFVYRRVGIAADACSSALSSTATVTITVNNQPPVAGPGTINTFACISSSIKVLDIASDPEGGALTAIIVTGPSHGSVTVKTDGTLLYTPTATYSGPDAFTYRVQDPLGATSAVATVSITVSGASNPNIAPIAVADSDVTLMEQPVYTNVIVNDSDPNNDVFSVSITALGLTAPASGTITLMPNKLIRYTPAAGFVGKDSYQYQITDTHIDGQVGCGINNNLSSVTTVNITVKGLPTTLSGTVWNDADQSAANTFTGIKTGIETGTSGNGGVFVYLVDNNSIILDKTPVDIDGTYSLSNVPSGTTNLQLLLSSEDVLVGAALTAGSVPSGYNNSTPLSRTLPVTTLTDMGPYDWGIFTNPTLTPGTIIAPDYVCSATATPGTLSSTANATGGSVTATGYVYQWESSITSNSTGFAAIIGANASSYTPSGALTTTTYFRRKVSTNLNAAVYSNVVSITYVTNPTVVIAPAIATISAGGNIGLTASGADSYTWAPSAGLSGTVTAGVTASSLSTTYYVVTGTLTPSGCTATAGITVTVINPGTIGADQNGCGPFTPGTLTSVADAIGTTGITYQWQSSIASASTGFANIVSATAATYTAGGAITTTTYYKRVATGGGQSYSSNVITATVKTVPVVSVLPTTVALAAGISATLTANGADSYTWLPTTDLSAGNTASVVTTPGSSVVYVVTGTLSSTGCTASASVTVTVTNAGTIGTNQANCGSYTPAPLTSIADGIGVAVTYQWQSSTVSAVTGFSDISSATATTYTPGGAITTTTYYKRIATSGGNSYSSNVISAVVNTIPTVSIAPTSVTIGLGLTQTLTASGANTYTWSPSGTLSASNGATVIATPTATTTYNVTGTVTATGCNNTSNVIVTVINPGVVAGNQANCGAFTPTAFTSTTDAGGTIGIAYQWQSSTTSAATGFTNIADAVFSTYSPIRRTATTYYRRVASVGINAYNSNVLTVTVNTIPVVVIAPTGATITAGLSQTFTASGADTYSWTPGTYLSATNTAAVLATPTAVGSTIYTVTGTITASGCTSTASVLLTASAAGALLPGTIGSPQTICSVTAPVAFTSTAATGGTGTINYQWQQSLDNVTFSNIPAATSANYGAGTLTQTYYYRRAASTSSDAAVYTASVKVNVLQRPAITGGINGVCAMPRDTIKTFSVTPATLATRYVWTVPATGGWSGASTTNTIDVKAGNTNGTISVTPYNLGCAGSQVTYNIAIIDYASVSITGTPVSASGTNNNPITVKIQLIDVLGNVIGCSGGPASLCSTGGTFTTVTDNGDGTYTSYLISTADNVTICGSVAGVQISKTTNVTFTGPQGGIKSNGPIFDFEIPKITFTATDGRAPFTVIYHSDKAAVGKNDTLTNVTSGTAYSVALIPSTTLYKLVSVIDANGERRDRNFNRDTTTTRVVTSKVIITLKADPAKKELDSTWATRIVVHTQNIGDLDLTNSQARLNLKDVFPSPVTYVLDSVKVAGTTVVQNGNYDGIINTDLFAKLKKKKTYNASAEDMSGMAPDGKENKEELWNNEDDETVVRVGDDGHSIYMFGPQSNLPVGMDATIILWLHVKPNGYTEPFIMQALALGTGHTQDATSLTTSLSNDNDNVNEHPEVTKKGDPLPAVINLFPVASVGISLNAGTPVLQGNGTYNVLLTYKVKNYGNVNLKNVTLQENLLRSIGTPSTFNVVGGVTASGGLIVNPSFDAKVDTNLLAANNILGYKQESIISYTINITPNQLASIYRLQALASGYSDDLLQTVTDLSTDGTEPDPDGNNIPSEKIITTIVINLPVPPLVPGTIGIKTGSTTVLANGYCGSANNVEIIPTSVNTGGVDAYLYQWQSSPDNVTFKDIIGAESANYTTGSVTSSYYLRRGTISGSQIKFSNSVYIQIYPVPAVPVITGTGTMVIGKGKITLTSPVATGYLWSTGATTRSILVGDPGNYTVTVSDVNGCTAIATAYAITALDPGKAADIQKILSAAPALQQDGSFLLSFNIIASNLRPELLDSVKIVDDLSKVFPTQSTFTIVDIKASGGLIANPSYDGKTNLQMLSDVSKLPGFKKDSVQMTIKVFPNGFSGTLNNIAVLTANSPLGFVSVSSNDPLTNTDPQVRAPTKFVLPVVDIFIPTGFSPNRDGYNDKFVITRPFNTTIKMEIYNRWSNLVYKSLDYKNEWDGKGNQANRVLGEDLPDGTYYYEILAVNQTTGAVRKFAGYITMKR